MAQLTYRGNLSTKIFPFISEYFGRSVIVAGQDQNFSRQLTSDQDLDKDRGIPQVYYCHNVMPSAEGFQSIGYNYKVSQNESGFNNIYNLKNSEGDEVYFSHTSNGKNYILPFNTSSWIETTLIPVTETSIVTTATINGQTYIYFSFVGCYLYDVVTNSLLPVTMDGLDVSTIIGITASAGYMIAWSSNAIAWSSTVERLIPTDPIDFVPSDITGAGGGQVEQAKGKITLCKEHYLGFIIYTTDNAVAAVYSGNSRYPFNLRAIVASGGLANQDLVSNDGASGNHYAYTTSGLQIVSVTQTQTIMPEVTDFIAGKYFEDYDENTFQFNTVQLNVPMKKAINVISDRYLVISYGVNSFTHALVYDIVQKRIGKLKIPHVCSFEYKLLTPEIIETPRESLGFLQSDGSIKTVDFAYASNVSNGVMILGKYQYVRSRLIQLQAVMLENIRVGNNFNIYNTYSLDGKNRIYELGYLAENYGLYRKYNFHSTGINHSIVCVGNFYMSSIELSFNIHGRR